MWTSLSSPAEVIRMANNRRRIQNMSSEIQTERLFLRRWLPTDRLPFAALNADVRVMRFLPAVLSRAQSDSLIMRIEAHFERHGFGLFALESKQSGEFLGFCGLNRPAFEAPFMPCVEIGWRLAVSAQGQGLATQAALAVRDLAFRELGLSEIVSFTVPHNAASRRVMEKIGMVHDPAADFDHPLLPPGNALAPHVFYRLPAPAST